MRSILLAAMALAATTIGAAAQTVAPGYPPPPYYPAPAISPAQALPPSWSYDPYTSGQAPCPQKRPGDTQSCSQIMPPTAGQPSYWAR